MKKTSIILISTILAPQLSLAADDHYVSVQVGGSMPTKKVDIVISKDHPYQGTLKSSSTFGASIGTRVYNNLFAELEYTYAPKYSISASSGSEDGALGKISTSTKIQSHSLFANLNYLIKQNSLPFTPYITLGAGMAHNRVKNVDSITTLGTIIVPASFNGQSQTNFAWQVGVGCLFPLNDALDLNLGIKYKDLGKVQSSIYNITNNGLNDTVPMKGRLSSVNFSLGLKYKF